MALLMCRADWLDSSPVMADTFWLTSRTAWTLPSVTP